MMMIMIPQRLISRQPARRFLSSQRTLTTTTTTPFYGAPRRSVLETSSTTSSRLGLAWDNAWTAWRDPTRADAVAAVGELTGTLALERLVQVVRAENPQLLQDRPTVSKATIPYQRLLDSANPSSDNNNTNNDNDNATFGQAYGAFLHRHGFDPDERDPIRFLDPDSDAAYVMLRYRQCHDFFHTLTGLPPTVPGELGLKWLELFQTGLPLAAMACTAGATTSQMTADQARLVRHHYLPWAVQVSRQMAFGQILCVYYEQEWDTPVAELRSRLGITLAPQVEDEEE